MRRIPTAFLVAFILMVSIVIPVFATAEIEITRQPQNSVFPENASAYWTVEATGDDLVYDWFIVYEGVAYNTITSFVENHPWQEGVTGDGYGRNDVGNGFFINGIGRALDGAEIYCVVSNETDSVTSQSTYISVGGEKSPPQLTVPALVTVGKDEILKLHCDALATDGDTVKSYTWYETASGELKDIVAIGAKENQPEENPILVCDTTQTGTRYYVCYVETGFGGRAYSSVIPVIVTEKAVSAETSTKSSDTERTSDPTPTTSPDRAGQSAAIGSTPETGGQDNNPEKTRIPSESNTRNAVPSPLTIALSAAGGVAVVGTGIAGIIMAHRKKKH